MPKLKDVARSYLALIVGVVVLLPVAAFAQGTAIAGAVTDTSGAVLPGVTVEAASPALIEQIRAVVTDGSGRYRIEGLRPGVYSVRFVLPGFRTFLREGIVLSAGFTAGVNAELSVGALEETITVTGESPVVDLQNAGRSSVLSTEDTDVLPVNRTPIFLAGLLPAVIMEGGSSADIGGSKGVVPTGAGVTVHGSRRTDLQQTANGLALTNFHTGSSPQGVANAAQYEQITVDFSGGDAEQPISGVRTNMIPADGGNTFSGTFVGAFMNDALQGTNFTKELEAAGLAAPDKINRVWDINPTLGGPIVRDKLWFFTTVRETEAWNFTPVFHNLNAGNADSWTYEPDSSRQGISKTQAWAGSGRGTWQMNPTHKIGVSYEANSVCNCSASSAVISPEAGDSTWFGTKQSVTVDYSAPLSSRVLLDGSLLMDRLPRIGLAAGSFPFIAVQEQSTGLLYRGQSDSTKGLFTRRAYRMALSYVSGSYTVKVGFSGMQGKSRRDDYLVGEPITYRFRNGVPNRLTLQAIPHVQKADIDQDTGIFGQARWTLDRLTLSGGLRFDYFATSFPETTLGPTEYTPDRNFTFPKTDGLAWKDISPRLGFAYDVFGTGKTALKGTFGRYLAGQALEGTTAGESNTRIFGRDLIPARQIVTTVNRNWDDANGNFIPDCDLTNQAANGECARGNPLFGTTRSGASYDPETLRGWGKRAYNNEFSVGVQQEVAPRTSVEVSYYRRWFGNWTVVDNLEVGPEDFTSYTVTAPVDSRLPGGGGYELTTRNVVPEKFGLTQTYVTFADKFGQKTEYWQGIDLTTNARPFDGLMLSGGLSTGGFTIDNCDFFRTLPETAGTTPLENCRREKPWQPSFKLFGSYILPRIDVQISGAFQSLQGPELSANVVLRNAQVAPSLGRSLSGRASNTTVNVLGPGEMYGERRNQLDMRVAKILQFDRTRLTVGLDIANLTNTNVVLRENSSYAVWRAPTTILTARFLKLSVNMSF